MSSNSISPNQKCLNPCHAKYFCVLHSSQIFILLTYSIEVVSMYFPIRVENSVGPDQMSPDNLDLECFSKRINFDSAGQGLIR